MEEFKKNPVECNYYITFCKSSINLNDDVCYCNHYLLNNYGNPPRKPTKTDNFTSFTSIYSLYNLYATKYPNNSQRSANLESWRLAEIATTDLKSL